MSENIPPRLTAKQLDYVLFYSDKNKEQAEGYVQLFQRLGFSGGLYDDNTVLEWNIYNTMHLARELMKRSTFKMLLVTKELDPYYNFHQCTALLNSITNRDDSVIPIFTIPKEELPDHGYFYSLKVYAGLYPEDPRFEEKVQKAFTNPDAVQKKTLREQQQEEELRKWKMEYSSHEIKLAIKNNYTWLVQQLDTEPLIIELYKQNVLTKEEREYVYEESTHRARINSLLTLILIKGDTTLQIFLEVLKITDQCHIYEALDDTIKHMRSVDQYYHRVHQQSNMEKSVDVSHGAEEPNYDIFSKSDVAESHKYDVTNIQDFKSLKDIMKEDEKQSEAAGIKLESQSGQSGGTKKKDQSSVEDSHESGITSLGSAVDSIAKYLANIGDQIETNQEVHVNFATDYEEQSGASPGDMNIPRRLRSQSSPVLMSHDEDDLEVAYIRSQFSAPYGSIKTLELKALPQVMDTSEEEDKEESKDAVEDICAHIPSDKDEKTGYFRIFDSKHKDKLEVHIPESALKRGLRVEDIQIFSREVIHMETIGSDTPINSASPVYEFLPHGTIFKEPVLIKFPIKMKCQFGLNGLRMLHTNTAQHETENWVEICPNDETHKDISWLVLDGTVYLWTSHFSKFTMVYDTGDKVPFRVLLYVDRDDEHMEAKLTVSFSCYCESQHLMKKLQKYGELVDEQSMPIDKKEGQVEISLNPNPFCAENWSLMDTSYKDLVYKDVLLSVCALNALPPHTSYKMYSKTGKFNRNSIVSVRVQQLPDGQNLCKPVLRWYMGEVLPRRTLMGSFLSGFWWLINKTFQWFTTWLFGFFQLKPLQRNVMCDRDDNIQNTVKQNKSVVDVESESSDVEQDNPSPVVQPDHPRSDMQPDNPRSDIQPHNPRSDVQPRSDIQPHNPRSDIQPDNPRSDVQPRSDIQPHNPRSDIQPDNPRSDVQPDNPRSDIQPDNSDGCLDNFGMLECDGIEPRVYHTSASSQTVRFRYKDNSSHKTPNGTLLDVNSRSGAYGDSDNNSHNIGVLPASHLSLIPSGDINGASGSMEEHIPEELYIPKNRSVAVALKPYRPQDVVPRDIPSLNYVSSVKTLNIQYIINTNNDSNKSSFDTEYEKYFPEEFGRDFYCYMLDFILELRNNEETLTNVITAAGVGPLRNPYPENLLCAWYESRRLKSSNVGFERKIWLPEFWCVLRNAGQQSLAKKLVGALEKVALNKQRPTFVKRLNECDAILCSLSSARVITDDMYTALFNMSEHLDKKRAKIISEVLSGGVEAIGTFKKILDETEQNDLLKAIEIDTSKFEEL